MLPLPDVPTWVVPIVAAICAGVGFVARDIYLWVGKHRESKRQRIDRLMYLERLLTESRNLFLSQRKHAQRLFNSVKQTNPAVADNGCTLNDVFCLAFDTFTPEQAELHAIIRGISETALRRVNFDLAEWLRKDDWFKQSKPNSSALAISLAGKLQELEQHLTVWEIIRSTVFAPNNKRALVYANDEQKLGSKFPTGIENLVSEKLAELRSTIS